MTEDVRSGAKRLGDDKAWAIFSDEVNVERARNHPDKGGARYRYVLGRKWSDVKSLQWVMLNPSTATDEKLDPTLEKCKKFSEAWGYGGMVILNAYAWRARDPTDLPALDRRPTVRAIGPANDWFIHLFAGGGYRDVVVGWGTHAHPDRAAAVFAIYEAAGCRIDCLRINEDGSPGHPLYIAADTERRPWSPRR